LDILFDGIGRKAVDPLLARLGSVLARRRITANSITISGFLIGVVAAFAIWQHAYMTAAFLIVISRLCDGLDGVVARANGASDLGGYLDIVLDFAFYGMIPFAFALANSQANAIPAAALLLSFYINGASFLAYAILAAKRGEETEARGKKSIFFTTGLAEASETLVVFLLACFWPLWFPVLAWAFAAVCIYTALSRILQAQTAFR
jgi:phosphatidylglycerophosphate synthase